MNAAGKDDRQDDRRRYGHDHAGRTPPLPAHGGPALFVQVVAVLGGLADHRAVAEPVQDHAAVDPEVLAAAGRLGSERSRRAESSDHAPFPGENERDHIVHEARGYRGSDRIAPGLPMKVCPYYTAV